MRSKSAPKILTQFPLVTGCHRCQEIRFSNACATRVQFYPVTVEVSIITDSCKAIRLVGAGTVQRDRRCEMVLALIVLFCSRLKFNN